MIGRISDRATLADVRRGQAGRCGAVGVRFRAAPDPAGPRVAFAIGRRSGNAVTRNRIRRRLRAAILDIHRQRVHGLSPGAYLVTAATDASSQPYADLVSDLRQAIDNACARR